MASETTSLLAQTKQSNRAGVAIEWQDIVQTQTIGSCFSKKSKEKVILDKVSGHVPAGNVLAIMGPSGAGKTSLLNILAGRAPKQSGVISVNDQIASSETLRNLSVYVMQDDILLQVFTVRESILFSALLRLPTKFSYREKSQKVDALIETLGLLNCADSFIKSISGGERKRTSIAIELITNPMVMFLDEPTSGLDSATALSVMKTVTKLAISEGHTVITTIHQPSSELFALFQRLLLLANGRVAYDGLAADVVGYFGKIGYVCPQNYNPADHVLKVLSLDDDKEQKNQSDIESILDAWKESQQQSSSNFVVKSPIVYQSAGLINDGDSLKPLNTSNAGIWVQWCQLSLRALKVFMRDPLRFGIAIAQTILVAMLVSLVYLNLGNDIKSITDRVGFFFFSVTSFVFVSTVALVLSMPNERHVFLREQDNKMYSPWLYYFSKVLSEVPMQIFFPLLFTLLVYWSVGLNYVDPAKTFIFWMAIVLLTLNGQACGMLIGVSVPDAITAISVVPIYIIPTMLFSGYFKDLETVPSYLIWISYVSPFRWGLDMLMVNEFSDLPLECNPSEWPGSICPISSGDQYLKFKNLEYEDMITAAVVLSMLTLLAHILALIILHIVVYIRHRSNIRS